MRSEALPNPADPCHSGNVKRTDSTRRGFIAAMAAGGAFFTRKGAFAQALTLTPSTTEGPYYPDRLPLDQDNDLIVLNDSVTPAIGTVSWISGRVLDRAGSPVRNALVEIWGADDLGSYIHSNGINRAAGRRDANYQGYGRFQTASNGEYLFRVVKPGLYPGRARHMHLKAGYPGGATLTTQLLIEGERENAGDQVLNEVRDAAQRASIVRPWVAIPDSPVGALATTFDIALGVTPSDAPTAARPTIFALGGVTHAATLRPGAAAGSWITVQGSGLSATTRGWRDTDLAGGRLPESLDGVSVRVNGAPAYVSYVSPGQINALAPDNAGDAAAQVAVSNASGASDPVSVDFRRVAPGFFQTTGENAAALRADGTLIGPPGLFPGVATVAARPGETVVLYGTGFGPVSPAPAAGEAVRTPAPVTAAVKVHIDATPAAVAFAGLTASGLYQINVTVPDLPDGDYPVTAEVGGVRTAKFVKLRIGK